jgi:hypothetical protein
VDTLCLELKKLAILVRYAHKYMSLNLSIAKDVLLWDAHLECACDIKNSVAHFIWIGCLASGEEVFARL